jgi:hypothetical protein
MKTGFFIWLLLFTGSASAEVVDRILHMVGDRLITTSDLAFEAEFVQVDISPVPPLNDPGYALEQRLIDYAILRPRAGDTAVFKPSAQEVRARLEVIQERQGGVGHEEFLKRWGLDDELLQGFLFSRMVVERFIHRSVGLGVGREEGYEERYRQLYMEWIGELRKTAVIRTPEGP